MVKGLYTAYTGMVNEMKRLDILSNNLANADTTGYKKEGTTSTTFGDELAIRIKDTSSHGINRAIGGITFGTELGQVYTDYSTGSFKVTDNESDFAISGDGFFAIEFRGKDGQTSVKYTRDGDFIVNTQGYLVTKDGNHVLNKAGALSGTGGEANYVRVDPNASFSVNESGFVYQNNQLIDDIGIVDFNNYDFLEKYGENLYNLLDGGEVTAANVAIEQGVLETSNVNVINEMVNMITIQRAYEAGQKVITSIDETLDISANQIGKL